MYYKTTVIRVYEVTDLKSEVKSDLRGHLEATMASEVMKIAFGGNMHIDISVIEVTELNFVVKSDLWGYLDAAMAKITLQLLERLPSCYFCPAYNCKCSLVVVD